MTNIYIYCVFDGVVNFMGVYSSLKSAHRDALKIANIQKIAERNVHPIRIILLSFMSE